MATFEDTRFAVGDVRRSAPLLTGIAERLIGMSSTAGTIGGVLT